MTFQLDCAHAGLALPPGCQCRIFSEEDIVDLHRIEAEINPSPWSEGDFLTSIRSNHICFGVTSQAGWLAYLVCFQSLDEAQVLILGVAKQWQRRGIGRILLSSLIAGLEQHSKILFLEVRESNRSAIRFYEMMGFNCLGQRPNYYPALTGNGRRETALLYAMELQAGV